MSGSVLPLKWLYYAELLFFNFSHLHKLPLPFKVYGPESRGGQGWGWGEGRDVLAEDWR